MTKTRSCCLLLSLAGLLVGQVAADGHSVQDLSKGEIAGIVIGSVGSALLLLCACWCCVRRCSRRSQRFQSGLDLERPLGTWGKGHPKDDDLVVSPNVVASLNPEDEVELQNMGGGQRLGSGPLSHHDSAREVLATKASDPLTKAASILKWLEGSDGSGTTQRGRGKGGAAGKGDQDDGSSTTALSSCLPLSINASAGPASTDLLRKRLLAAGAGGAYAGDSAKHPLDVKGIVFNRLPASTHASPAPSTIDTALSRVRTARATRDLEPVPDTGDLIELGAPEQQGMSAATAALVRVDSFGSQASFRPGVTFASISMDRSSAQGAAPQLGRTSMTRGSSRLSRAAADSVVTAVPEGHAMSYSQAVSVLQQAAGGVPHGSRPPPVDVQPYGAGGSAAPTVGLLVADTLPTLTEESSQYTTTAYSTTVASSNANTPVLSPSSTLASGRGSPHPTSIAGQGSFGHHVPGVVPHRGSASGVPSRLSASGTGAHGLPPKPRQSGSGNAPA